MLTPRTVTAPEALIVAVPGWFEFAMIVHSPLAFVGPVGPQVPPVIEPKFVVELIVTPAAALQPVPSFFSTSTVKVCGSPTSFTPLVPIEIRASTQVFVFLMSCAPSPFVATVIATPPTVTVPVAWTVAVPGTSELTVTVHSPAAFVGPVGPQVPPVIDP